MGVEPFLIATSLSCVVAQRLVRKPCPSCARPYEPTPRVLAQLGLKREDLAGATPLRGRGCGDCGNTGYRGRTGVFEVVPVTAGLRSVLTKAPSEAAIAAAARAAGVTTLRRAAVMRALRGETTFEEVLRVSHADSLGGSTCPGCSRRLADDMVVCPWCDIPLGRGHCMSCARPLDPEWQLCPWCRASAPVAPTPMRLVHHDLPHVLIVDDDPSVCAFVAAALAGHAIVDEAADATTALRMAQEGDYDVAVIDHRLPDLSGIELIRLLRNDVGTAGLPLLMFTGIDAQAIESDARHAGADGFLSKPVEPATLQEHVLALAARGLALPT